MKAAGERSFCFTVHGKEALLGTTQDRLFASRDAEMILESLKNQIGFIPFCDYLKRYVYIKSGMTGHFREIPLQTYEQTITDAFRKTGTPCSFTDTKTPLRTRVRSWLSQTTVRRNVVLLLGFGLSMGTGDVNRFLTNAVHDHVLDENDPLEAVCLYCYERGYRYSKMKQLWQLYQSGDPEQTSREALLALQPRGRLPSYRVAEEDYELLSRLADLERSDRPLTLREKTAETFHNLYCQASSLTGNLREDSLSGQVLAEKPKSIEKILYSSLPRDRHGNLAPELSSSMKRKLAGKRLSRQHLYELIHNKVQPSRYDLISLQFLAFSVQTDHCPDPGDRFARFSEETNRILLSCGFGPLYTADPYECFILMCILSVDPIGTYADVQELSYSNTQEKKNDSE